MSSKIFILTVLVVTLTLSGCITAKVVERERVDQEVAGNQGYLMGNAPSGTGQAEGGTRKFIKVDVEMPPYSLKEKTPDKEVWGNQGYVNQEGVIQPPKPTCIFPPRRVITEKEEVVRETRQTKTCAKPTLTTYKVKKNDSLWKIAQRPDVYGNGNKWKKIYEANKEKIKTPNKLRPGIELVIPQD